MSLGAEVTRSDIWLFERLKAIPSVALVGGAANPRIFPDAGPLGADHPLIVFQLQSPADEVRGVGGGRYVTKPLYLVKAVAKQGNWQGSLKTLADEIDAVLQNAPGGPAGSDGTVVGCLREGMFRLPDPDGFRHLGGFYRVWVNVG